MKSKTRERAIRIFLSAVLESDLTLNELRDVAEAMVNEVEFGRKLGMLLLDFTREIEAKEVFGGTKNARIHAGSVEKQVDEAFSSIQNKRVPKSDIIDIIKNILPEQRDLFTRKRSTLREQLSLFFREATPSEANAFTNRIMDLPCPLYKPDRERILSEILSVVRKKRMAKSEFIKILKIVSPNMKNLLANDELTLKRTLMLFLDTASDSEIRYFTELLCPGRDSSDEYLRGIMKNI